MIIGLSLKKVEAIANNVGRASQLSVNSAPIIKSVDASKIPQFGIENALVIGFSFETVYEPKAGSIKIEGDVIYKDDDAKHIADEWKKSKKLSDKVAIPVINAIFKRCLVKAMNEATDLQLPSPIKIPSVREAPKAQKK